MINQKYAIDLHIVCSTLKDLLMLQASALVFGVLPSVQLNSVLIVYQLIQKGDKTNEEIIS